jgi:hypothetical protein
MTLCTLSALLLASPFAADLLDLTARLVPRLLEVARLIQQFRAAGPSPESTGSARPDRPQRYGRRASLVVNLCGRHKILLRAVNVRPAFPGKGMGTPP